MPEADHVADAIQAGLATLAPAVAAAVVFWGLLSRRVGDPRRRLLDELRLVLARRLRECAGDLERKARALDDRRAGARSSPDDDRPE